MRTYAGAPRAWHGPFGLPPLWSKPARSAFFSAMSVILPYIALLLLETDTEAKGAAAVALGGVVVRLAERRPVPPLFQEPPRRTRSSPMPVRWDPPPGCRWDRPPGTSPRSTPTHFHAYQKSPTGWPHIAHITGLAQTTSHE